MIMDRKPPVLRTLSPKAQLVTRVTAGPLDITHESAERNLENTEYESGTEV
jgi:hypothetical protein